MKKQTIAGILIAPITGPLVYIMAVLFLPNFFVTHNKPASDGQFIAGALLFLSYSYVISFTIGFPLVLTLKKIKLLSNYSIVIIGSALYSFCLYLMFFVVMDGEIIGNKTKVVSITLFIGVLLGLTITTSFIWISGITRSGVKNVFQ